MSESDLDPGGCLMAAAIAFAVILLVACIPALPFWIGGHTVWGGLAYVLVGLPMGIIAVFVWALCMAAKKGDEDPGPDDDDDRKHQEFLLRGVEDGCEDVRCNEEFQSKDDLVGQVDTDLVIGILYLPQLHEKHPDSCFDAAIDDKECADHLEEEGQYLQEFKECRIDFQTQETHSQRWARTI